MVGSILDTPLSVATARAAIVQLFLNGSAGATLRRLDTRKADVVRAADSAAADFAWLGIEVQAASAADSAARCAEVAEGLVAGGRATRKRGAVLLDIPAGQVVIADAVAGQRSFENAALGEIVLVDAEGSAGSELLEALDELQTGTGWIVRDAAQFERTARTMLVYSALGRAAPRCAHLGAVLPDAAGETVPTIAQLRRAGYVAGAVVEHLALLGVAGPAPAVPASLAQLAADFRIERMSPAAVAFDAERLRERNGRYLRALPADALAQLLASAMQRAGLLEDPVPDAARRWIATFLAAYGSAFATLGDALRIAADLRAEATLVPALELERLRNRQVVFYLDAVGQYVDAQPELRQLPLAHDLPEIAREFGLTNEDAFAALRMALCGSRSGPPLELLFPLLGHDRILIRIGAISSHLLHGRGLEPIKYGPGGVPFETIAAQRPPGR